jgi:hypothetical protein
MARMLMTLAIAGAAGCAGRQWHVLPSPPDSLASWPNEVRVTLNDGTRVVVASPRLRNDSLFGRGETGLVALPLASVSRVAVEGANPDRPAATRMLLVAAGITVAVLLGLVLAAQ